MEKETSCVNSRSIFEYVKEFNNGDCSGLLGDLDPEIDGLSDPEAFLIDPNHWISCAVIAKLYERARHILNDDIAPFKMAKFAIENASLGYIQQIFVKAFWSYAKAAKHLQTINDKLNRSKKIELIDIKKNRAVVRLFWEPGMGVSKDICLYNQGTYTFITHIWKGKPVKVEEKCCHFDGAPYCEYHLKWPARNRLYEIFSRLFSSKAVFMDTVAEMEKDKAVIEKKYEEVNGLNLALNQKVQQLTAINKTGKAILSVLDLEPLLTVIMDLLHETCHINRALIMLVNEKDGVLEYIHATGFDGEIPEAVRNYRIPVDRTENIMARAVKAREPEYVPDVENSKLRKDNVILVFGKPRSVYAVPLITPSGAVGVIATDAVNEEGIPKETRDTLNIFAPHIAIAIENAKLYNKLKEQMKEIKRSQALLSRAEKFSFLGNLAAKLAHEIKNPMTAIGTFIQLLPQKYDDKEFREDFHKIAVEETGRVNDLITALLDLVKVKGTHFEFEDLHALINSMVLLVSPQTNSKKVEVTTQFDPDVGRVKMDAAKIKQVILNILSNAVEILGEGGRIDIVTKGFVDGKRTDSVRIEIKDNGPGVSQSVVEKIFDPYFTTKGRRGMLQGTGLGLFVAHQNMEEHGGHIEVKTKENEGTNFILTLPVDRTAAAQEDLH
ncbi:MAG: GAF domain-containing protein [Desulfobacterales bacterium]|nr:GAF domain-containing protein [Desulfobacterales bacterium]